MNKTKSMIILSNRMSVHSSLTSVSHILDTNVSFVSSVKNLGISPAANLSMSQHMSNMCKATYVQIRHMGSIWHLLTTQATQTLYALALSRLGYCNSLLSGCPQYSLDKLQKVQNAAARLVCKAKESDRIHPVLEAVHCDKQLFHLPWCVSPVSHSKRMSSLWSHRWWWSGHYNEAEDTSSHHQPWTHTDSSPHAHTQNYLILSWVWWWSGHYKKAEDNIISFSHAHTLNHLILSSLLVQRYFWPGCYKSHTLTHTESSHSERSAYAVLLLAWWLQVPYTHTHWIISFWAVCLCSVTFGLEVTNPIHSHTLNHLILLMQCYFWPGGYKSHTLTHTESSHSEQSAYAALLLAWKLQVPYTHTH